jgi:hypothetical protein
MAKFRKKPVVIEAFQFNPTHHPMMGWIADKSPAWFMLAQCDGIAKIWSDDEEPYCMIKTFEGSMKANLGDWIIKGIKDEIYPCKPDIFAATYEAVD